jgi:hypothetical protein
MVITSYADATEADLIEDLFYGSETWFSSLDFMIQKCIGMRHFGWAIDFWVNVKREKFGLSAGERPGDIDILGIPTFEGDRFPERAFAVEVKKAFIPRWKRDRSPGSFGTEQVNGLARDGFPFFGLLHLILVEESDRAQFFPIPIISSVDENGNYITEEVLSIDPSTTDVNFRHESRVEKLDQITEEAGVKVCTWGLTKENRVVNSWSTNGYRSPTKNPRVSNSLVECLRQFSPKADYTIEFKYFENKIIRRRLPNEEPNVKVRQIKTAKTAD